MIITIIVIAIIITIIITIMVLIIIIRVPNWQSSTIDLTDLYPLTRVPFRIVIKGKTSENATSKFFIFPD